MPRALASIVFPPGAWWWVALAAAVVLVPLALVALRPAHTRKGTLAVALALRTLGIGLLLLCLLDPQWATPRAKPGANFIALVADNSASLTIHDAGATQSRGEQIKTALTSPDSHWLASLGEQFQIKPYIFDTNLQRVRDFSGLDFSGERTSLGGALHEVQQRLAGQPLAGIVVFTDGDATDVSEFSQALGQVPIYPVLVGNATGLRNVRLAQVDVQQTAFDDAPVSVRAEVEGEGIGTQALSVAVKPLNAPTPKKGESDPTPTPQITHLVADNEPVDVSFDWHPLGSGPQFFNVSVGSADGKPLDEATTANNHRMVMVDRGRPTYHILYVTGTVNTDYKYLKSALADDPQMDIVGIIREAKGTPKWAFIGHDADTVNAFFAGSDQAKDDSQAPDQPVLRVDNYRDVRERIELQTGFPTSPAKLYAYDAVILSKVEASFFTTDQLALLRRFVAERGGGLLVLGGVDSFEDGGYLNTPLAAALPVYLDRKSATIPQGDLIWNLTREGWIEPWMRVRATEADEREALVSAPHLLVANALNGVKPGATVLATVTDEAAKVFPAFIEQNYGSGRVACLTVGDMYEGRIGDAAQMTDLKRFWRQVSRWLVTDDPAPVELKVEPSSDGRSVSLRVTARDDEFRPLDLGKATVKVSRVAASTAATASTFQEVPLTAEPVPDAPGQFAATFTPPESGAYLAEAVVVDRANQEIGRAQSGWVDDPAIEEFQSLGPNRPLMEEVARRTGGQVIPWDQLDQLPKLLQNHAAPITEDDLHPLWNQSGVFLAVLLCFLAEWGWRRWKGLP
jgi:uncharacterized membrane protein